MVNNYDKISTERGKENPINQKGTKTMKSLWVCEKCGKRFYDYDECYKHENNHWTLERGLSNLDNTLDSMTEYKEDQEEPNAIHVVFGKWDSEKQEYVKRCGKYKLVSSYDAPLVIEKE